MSNVAARRLLWLTFVCVVPLPFFLVEIGAVPAIRILQLSGALAAIVVVEGAHGMIGIALALLLLQALAYVAALAVVARVVVGVVSSGSRRRTLAFTALTVVSLVAVALTTDLYRTPFRTRALTGNLSEVLE